MRETIRKHGEIYMIKALIITTIFVAILGYVDYITGEISIDVLYILCICLVTWYASTFLGILCVVEILFAKTTADYFDKIKVGSHLYEWAAFNNIVIYVIICLLAGKVKKELMK